MANTTEIVPINRNSDIEQYEIEDIKQKIYTIRGKQVMLDSDVAILYHYETKKINQAVKRNIDRFPEKFCFRLTENELDDNWSQFVTSSSKEDIKHRGKKYLPLAFTEQGIAMLSGILKNQIAVQVSINIMDAFVEMRKFMVNNGQIFSRLTNIEYKLLDYDKKFDKVFNELQYEENIKQKIFFDGQVYDAFSMMIDLIQKAEKEIILIDNYVDINTLNILSKKNNGVNVELYTKKDTKLTVKDVNKFNMQYPSLEVKYTDKFHDRFLILDGKLIYHIGASLKDLGNKCFGITLIKYDSIIKDILSKL